MTSDADERAIQFNKMIRSESICMFFIILGLSAFWALPLIKNGMIGPLDVLAAILIACGELSIISLAIDSTIQIYRINHPKKEFPTEAVCQGGIP